MVSGSYISGSFSFYCSLLGWSGFLEIVYNLESKYSENENVFWIYRVLRGFLEAILMEL